MHDIDFRKIALRLKEIRIAKGITQEYVANIADVNTSHISNIENNRAKVSLPTLVQMCNALDTTVDYILEDEYTSPQTTLEQEILYELQLCPYDTQKQILKIINFKNHQSLAKLKARLRLTSQSGLICSKYIFYAAFILSL